MTGTVLIYRLGSLGDTIVALPCFNAIREAHRAQRKVLLTNWPVSSKAAPLESILGAKTGFFDDVFAYPVALRRPREILRLVTELRRLRIDKLIYLTPSRGGLATIRDWLFFRIVGVRKIIGLPIGKGKAQCLRLQDGSLEPEAARLARCLEGDYQISLPAPASWNLHLTLEELEAGKAAVGGFGGLPFIAINTGGKVPQKDWGLSNWQDLLRRLSKKLPSIGLLIVGAAEDSSRAQILSQSWNGPVANICGLLTPRESGAALSGARIFIGHDSGPLHLAAAFGVACVGLYGNYNEPAMWHPIGHHRILHEMRGIHCIEIAEVERSVIEVLELGKHG